MIVQSAFTNPVVAQSPQGMRSDARVAEQSQVARPGDQVSLDGGVYHFRGADGRILPLPAEGQMVSVGRLDTSEVRLQNDSVSRKHATICTRDNTLWVRDEQSANGTRFNGHPLAPGQWYQVPEGTVLSFGEELMLVERAATPNPSVASPAATAQRGSLQSAGASSAVHAASAAAGSVPAVALGVAGDVLKLMTPDGRAFPLRTDGQPMAVGRQQGSDILIGDGRVSRAHAAIRVMDGQVQVQDTGSANGTVINGYALQPQQWYVLEEGSQVAFAGNAMQLARESRPAVTDAGRNWMAQAGGLLARGAAAIGIGGPAGAGVALTLDSLKDLAQHTRLESKSAYLHSVETAHAEMAQQTGIVDLKPGVPTILVPDLHARREFLVRVLDSEIGGERVFDLLQQGRLNMVCLGDGMHAEGRAKERWQNAVGEFLQDRKSPSLDQEMVESLGTMKMVMDLKTAFPDNFHYVRGNHDDVDGFKFSKYAGAIGESALVREWIKDQFGPDFLQQYATFERSMPLVVKGPGFVASHAAPGASLTREQVAGRTPEAFKALTWTDNTQWDPADGSHQRDMRNTLQAVGADPNSLWFAGHRTVNEGLYRSQMQGQFIQINSPNEHVVALVGARGEFDPARNVVRL